MFLNIKHLSLLEGLTQLLSKKGGRACSSFKNLDLRVNQSLNLRVTNCEKNVFLYFTALIINSISELVLNSSKV